jgi:rhodanese-related sulfurtransferase
MIKDHTQDPSNESSLTRRESKRGRGGTRMVVTLTAILAGALFSALVVKRTADRRELKRHSITPEALRGQLASAGHTLLYDVRHPLDLLGDSVIIPGAKWLDPRDVFENPALLPRQQDVVVYCTCPSAKTSRAILHQALASGFSQIKFLKGGLQEWKARGFPVERYRKPFRLDRGKSTASATMTP